ncbi:MAG: MFS transporter [Alphaproteobacteria bacterium]|nr:MFS transporter [Alphaproteobacteria bacterium]
MTSQERVSWSTLLSGPNRGLFAVLSFGVWLHAADGTVIATLLPGVVADVGGEAFISWNFVLYLLASITAACSSALTARILGLRRLMIWSALGVAVGCLISAVTPTMGGMIAGRVLQGFGGGMLVACTMIGVAQLFPSHYTPRVMAAISAVWGSSAFLGPLVGGIFAEYGLWRMGFWAFCAQAVLLAIALRWAMPASTSPSTDGGRLPWRRLLVLSVAVLCIATAGLLRDSLIIMAVLSCAGVLGLGLFLRLDKAATSSRLLPISITDLSHVTGIGLIGIFLASFATIAFSVYGPVLLHRLHDVGPLGVGYMIALESVAWSIGALSLAGLALRQQVIVIRLSFGAIFLATIGLTLFVTPGPVWALLPCLFVTGGGLGACFGHILQRCIEAAPPDDKDRAASAITTVQTVGYTLGAAVSGLVANLVGYGDQPSFEAAQLAGFWVFAAMVPVSALALLLIWRLRR